MKPAQLTPKLCVGCKSIDLGNSRELHLDTRNLQQMASECDICGFFYKCLDWSPSQDGVVHIVRDGATLRLGETGPPVASIYMDPGMAANLSCRPD